MAKVCPVCGYDKNNDFARICGNCEHPFEGTVTSMTTGQNRALDFQNRSIGKDLVTLYEIMFRAAEQFEKHNLSWHVGGKHIRAFELKRKVRQLQSRLEDEALAAYQAIVVAQIQERVEIQRLYHLSNVEKVRIQYEMDIERERLAAILTQIIYALEAIEETIKTGLRGVDEDIKQQFIEDIFRRMLDRYLGEVSADNSSGRPWTGMEDG